MVYLRDVAHISSGLSFRVRVEHEPSGNVAVVQMRDLIRDYTAIGSECARVPLETKYVKHLLQEGDVLLLAKGLQNHAVLRGPSALLSVASSVFFVLRPNAEKIHPRYLLWFLNHSKTQQHLKQFHSGTYTPSLKKEAVEQLEIPLPPLRRQELIGAVHQCGIDEKLLRTRLADLREQEIQTYLYHKTLKDL